MTDLKLAIFDVDGTLVDSQADILASMEAAFAETGRPSPDRKSVLGVVGLSLPQAIAQLAPDMPPTILDKMVEAYKTRYAALRQSGGTEASPLFPGMTDLLERLSQVDHLLLGIATGKSRRGLDALLQSLNLGRYFVTTQVADDHPSKPHPSMLLTAMVEAGVEPANAVMIGDTSFDMEMAQAARMPAIGVSWGYHPATSLGAARCVVEDAEGLETAIRETLGEPA